MSSFADGTSEESQFENLLPPDESLDEDELDIDLDTGYSPVERPLGAGTWGVTPWEEAVGEGLAGRLAREVPDVGTESDGDSTGFSFDPEGELVDDQVGDARAGRLVFGDLDPDDPDAQYWAVDVGIDGGAASAEEAAMHIVTIEDPDDQDDARLAPDLDARPTRRHVGTTDATGTLDDLAAFLMHRTVDPAMTDADRLETFALVDAYQDGDDPIAVEAALREHGVRYQQHPDYRAEWRPGDSSEG